LFTSRIGCHRFFIAGAKERSPWNAHTEGIVQHLMLAVIDANYRWYHAPQNARSFVWVYPCTRLTKEMSSTGLTKIMLDTAKTCPDYSLLVFGGFMYLDKKGTVVSTTAFATGVASSGTIELEFAKSEVVTPDHIAALTLEFEPVTIAEFQKKGAMSFCWVPPKTTIGGHVVKDGGFA
jgi:hypothetical protein